MFFFSTSIEGKVSLCIVGIAGASQESGHCSRTLQQGRCRRVRPIATCSLRLPGVSHLLN